MAGRRQRVSFSNTGEIFGLALALVLVTVVGIGFMIYWLVPGIPLIPAFALAAVLSPTDAVALSGIVGEGRIPKKIMGILQGEALMNDASGLVSLKFAVAVAMGTMVFTVGGATLEFFKVAIGGIWPVLSSAGCTGGLCVFSAAGVAMSRQRKSSCCSCCHLHLT